jgi:hypothetical protein
VVNVTEDTALINVSSETQQVEMTAGDVEKFELTNDSYYDLMVELLSIEDQKANITVQSIHEEIVKDSEETVNETETAEETEQPENETDRPAQTESQKGYWWIILIIVIIAGGVAGYLIYRKNQIENMKNES